MVKFIIAIMMVGMVGCGRNGRAGVDGGVGPQGAQGNAGATGAQGAPGNPGSNGLNGTNGTNGADAAPLTIVPFCPGFTPSYPNVFPEYGICLQNQLYGVYSANGGFMALLPPGTYSSNGINASCTFTISANCQVN